MTCTLIHMKTRERTELPERPKGWSPYARVYLMNLELWHRQCRLAAEYACQVFGMDTQRDGKPSDTE